MKRRTYRRIWEDTQADIARVQDQLIPSLGHSHLSEDRQKALDQIINDILNVPFWDDMACQVFANSEHPASDIARAREACSLALEQLNAEDPGYARHIRNQEARYASFLVARAATLIVNLEIAKEAIQHPDSGFLPGARSFRPDMSVEDLVTAVGELVPDIDLWQNPPDLSRTFRKARTPPQGWFHDPGIPDPEDP